MIKIATLVGCAIGDALGNPFEMWPADEIAAENWDGLFKAGGTFWEGQPGQYTDDTLMSIYLSQSILDNQGFIPKEAAKSYLKWYKTGNTRGIGTTTAEAIVGLQTGLDWTESGLTSPKAAGNGSAMRAAPIGLYYRHSFNKLINKAELDASITHNNLEPKAGSIAVALATAMLANRSREHYDIMPAVLAYLPESIVKNKITLAINHIYNNTNYEEALKDIGVSGYVPETVGAALYCFAKTSSFKDAVLMAVKAGGDTDTTGAVVGALAGTYYGLDAIPDEYKDQVENFELLRELTAKLISSSTQLA
jgi:ADP-ribosyl-[dinitrogen reductase] hydrolase